MKKIIIMFMSFWVAYGSTAYAKCGRSDAAGTWNIYFGIGTVVARCTIKAPKIEKGSYCYLPGIISSVPLTGYLALASNCHVSGNLVIYSSSVAVDGWISKDKETISGMTWDPTNNIGAVFSGVKR